MRENINKVSQRGERLDSLQDKTDNLAVSAQGFRRGANRVRKQMWWKDMKMRICLIVGIIILLLVIIVPAGKLIVYHGLRYHTNPAKLLLLDISNSPPNNIHLVPPPAQTFKDQASATHEYSLHDCMFPADESWLIGQARPHRAFY